MSKSHILEAVRAAGPLPQRSPGSWIVQLATPSAAAALAPPTGDRAAVAAVVAHPSTDRRGRNVTAARVQAQGVEAFISEVAGATGVEGKVTQRFNYALSGFSVKDITLEELQALRSSPQVLSVTPSRFYRTGTNTYTSPWFLGLTPKEGGSQNEGSVWERVGGAMLHSTAQSYCRHREDTVHAYGASVQTHRRLTVCDRSVVDDSHAGRLLQYLPCGIPCRQPQVVLRMLCQ